MNLKRIDAAIAALKGSDAALDGRLAFFCGIWEIQERFARAAAEARPYGVPAAAEVEQWVAAGDSVLSQAPASIDGGLFVEAAGEIASYLAREGGFDEKSARFLEAADWSQVALSVPVEVAGANPAAYLDAAMERASEADEDHARLAGMVLSLALRPMLEAGAHAVAGLLHSGLVRRREGGRPMSCPVCGGEPTLAYVGRTPADNGNGRLLWCSQCGADWEFERVRCPRCGTTNQTHLHYVSREGDEGRRAYVCDECGGYVRTRFVAELDRVPFSFEVEDVVMADLDALANAGAFKRREKE